MVLLVLSFPLLMLGIRDWKEADREAGVRAWQLQQAASASDPRVRADFADYAESTLYRQQDAEQSRNWLLGMAVIGAGAGIVLLFTGRRRAATVEESEEVAAAAEPPPPRFRPCRACQWRMSVEASACPRCGCPHEPESAVVESASPLPMRRAQFAFYLALLVLGLGSAVVIYTVLFDGLSETELVRISPYWLFPSVFGYYGLVALRMEARLQASHRDNVSDQLLDVIKEIGGHLGQAFAFLVHAPFLIVKSRQPWVVAFVGSLIWAMALVVFFDVVFPGL
ncbi:hypothetical protein ABGB16_24620 [Micromonospora sp. B11E3]|uniref:hypothetical protein n=1 Tax=Micromonospora sp. B11E3 TaxID=3153562 RepID=UPI00325C45C2